MTETPEPPEAPVVPPVRLALPQDDGAPGQARRFAKDVLSEWVLPALIDVVVLAVSELVTNAVRHGRAPVWLELRRTSERVQVDVHDAAPPMAVPRPVAGDDAESGRGLGIVGLLASDLEVVDVPDDGKVVVASFALGEDGPPAAEAAPGA